LLADPDPFIRNAAVRQLAQSPELLASAHANANPDRWQRIGLLLAQRASGSPDASKRLSAFLADPDEEVRFLAVKWIADGKLLDYRPTVVEAMKERGITARMYYALATARARLDGQEVSETKMAEHFLARLGDGQLAPAVRARVLQLVPASHPKLKLDLLADL